jgi:hypothetical protein
VDQILCMDLKKRLKKQRSNMFCNTICVKVIEMEKCNSGCTESYKWSSRTVNMAVLGVHQMSLIGLNNLFRFKIN